MTKIVFGVVFVAVAVLAAAGGSDIDLSTAWLWVVALGGIGVAGLVASIDGLIRWRAASASRATERAEPRRGA
jgi:hypothetical protein